MNNLTSYDAFEIINESNSNLNDPVLFEDDTFSVTIGTEVFEANIRQTKKALKKNGTAGAIVRKLKQDDGFKRTEEKLKKLAKSLLPKIADELGISPIKAKKILGKVSISLK